MRFRLNGGPYRYGGTDGFNGNFWNGTTYNNGVLTVNPNPTQCATLNTPANAAVNVARGTVALTWTAPTTGPAPTGYKVYFGTTAGTTTLVTTTGASVFTYNATAPAYSTTYYWRVVPTSTIGGDAAGCAEFSFTTEADPFAPYCSTNVTYTSDVEPITLVNFAGINNASSNVVDGTPGLENFIAISGNVTTENTYAMTLKGNTNGSYTSYFRIFVDWNQDGDFNDANESIDGGSVNSSTGIDAKQAVTNITIPANALAGDTRMRIKKLYSFSAPTSWDACTGGGFGQTEDYTLNVTLCTPSTWYADADGDSYGDASVSVSACFAPAGYVANNTDCDDSDDEIYQSAELYVDADNDGYTTGVTAIICYGATIPAGYVGSLTAIDCNDAAASVNPGATEIAYNGIDDD
ncbi:MAG TPA: GEVED domain-containing protein, partial [Flavobacterium sp.]|nr:GEVED domain-containing protein [Flavobacterium sp.]